MTSLQPIFHDPKTVFLRYFSWGPSNILAIIFLLPVFRSIYIDYCKYIALGPGGTPSTVAGYVRIKVLGLFALADPLEPPQIPLYMTQREGRLTRLPRREGTRPRTWGIAPHRQVKQTAPPHIFVAMSTAISAIAMENENIEEGTSCFEKHGRGLFSTFPLRRTCKGEICHAHASDGSIHLTLHPADAKIMLEAGWGERHPLARGGWLERFVPGGFVMLYAPRNEEEINVVLDLIQAAAWWVGGEDIKTPRHVRRDSGIDVDAVRSSELFQAARQSSILANQALFEL